MKYLIAILITSFYVFINFYTDDYKGTEVTITIPELNNLQTKTHLENEFKKERTIEYVDGSLLTTTLVIKVDDENFSKKKIDHMLEKWGCQAIDYYYRKLNDFKAN